MKIKIVYDERSSYYKLFINDTYVDVFLFKSSAKREARRFAKHGPYETRNVEEYRL